MQYPGFLGDGFARLQGAVVKSDFMATRVWPSQNGNIPIEKLCPGSVLNGWNKAEASVLLWVLSYKCPAFMEAEL